MTARQAEILAYIVEYGSERGFPPSLREICEAKGMRSTRAASDHIAALVRKGYLSKDRHRSRAIKVVQQGDPCPHCGRS
jgi:repressor LexA